MNRNLGTRTGYINAALLTVVGLLLYAGGSANDDGGLAAVGIAAMTGGVLYWVANLATQRRRQDSTE